VDFDVLPGEVHALMGQNGAGKTTLIKVFTGAHLPDGGTMTLEGKDYRPASPADAQRLGLGAIHQEGGLVRTLSVAENLHLGRAPRRWFGLDWREMRRRSREILGPFGLDLDVDRPLGEYSAAVQQMVAIARAVAGEAKLIVMDEPTSSLDARETDLLFETIRRLKARGLGLVFITHFLDQVYRISDRITVMRNGARVGTFPSAELPKAELVARMLGEAASGGAAAPAAPARAPGAGPAVLSCKGLHRRGAVEPVDLEVRRGEVLGLAGLLGSGRTETARLLFGADRPDGGAIEVDGRPVPMKSPREAIARGLAFCAEDRQAEGIVPDMTLRENIALVVQRRSGRLGIVSRRAQERLADEFIRALRIKTPDAEAPIRTLSGGNQQKAILARWLACQPRVLILDEPTRGIDVGAKAEIERLVERLSGEGMSIVFISGELEEVARRAHRIAVLRDRKKVADLGGGADLERIMAAIAGEKPHGV
jgi:simple sugar transport system ATP-binding protein